MYKACIFDLDGTIADTVESIAYVGNKTLKEFGLPSIPVKDYNFYAGDGADELVRRMLAAVPGGDEADYEAVRVLYRKWFGENPFYHVKPFEGIVALLEGLKQQGLKIAVFSNKPHEAAVEVVHKIFGEQMFHKVQGQTAEIPRKPSPLGALAIAREFGVKPEECLYCGDTNIRRMSLLTSRRKFWILPEGADNRHDSRKRCISIQQENKEEEKLCMSIVKNVF